MKIEVINGLVAVKEEDILEHSNIRDMFVTGNGSSLQLCKELESRWNEIDAILSDIADNIYRLEDILSNVRK